MSIINRIFLQIQIVVHEQVLPIKRANYRWYIDSLSHLDQEESDLMLAPLALGIF